MIPYPQFKGPLKAWIVSPYPELKGPLKAWIKSQYAQLKGQPKVWFLRMGIKNTRHKSV